MFEPLLGPGDVSRLREALESAAYTTDGLKDRLGAAVVGDIECGDLGAALPAVGDDDRLGALVRMFLFGETIPLAEAASALGPLPTDSAVDAGFIEPWQDGVRARLQLVPYQGRWFLADPPYSLTRPMTADHVVGLSSYPAVLAAATLDRPVSTALDVCTGSGVQALHLGTRAARVTATDLNPRALRFAATAAALAGQDWELLQGDLLSPVTGRHFDLVVANPPFIVKPGAVDYLYRDSGHPLDSLGAALAAAAPSVLSDGGVMQYLAAFVHLKGEDWRERVVGWVKGTGCDARIIQLGQADPLGYVRNWSTGHTDQTGRTDHAAQLAWLAWLTEQRIDAIGWGLVNLRNAHHDDPAIRVEELPGATITGTDIGTWFDRQTWLHDNHTSTDLLHTRYLPAENLTLTQHARLTNTEGWRVAQHLITTPTATDRTNRVDQVVVDLIERCNGVATAHDLLTSLAADYHLHPAQLDTITDTVTTALALLVERGILIPQTGPQM